MRNFCYSCLLFLPSLYLVPRMSACSCCSRVGWQLPPACPGWCGRAAGHALCWAQRFGDGHLIGSVGQKEDCLDQCRLSGSGFPNYTLYSQLQGIYSCFWGYGICLSSFVFVGMCLFFIQVSASSIFSGMTHGGTERRCLPSSHGK